MVSDLAVVPCVSCGASDYCAGECGRLMDWCSLAFGWSEQRSYDDAYKVHDLVVRDGYAPCPA